MYVPRLVLAWGAEIDDHYLGQSRCVARNRTYRRIAFVASATVRVSIDPSALREIEWRQYALRFALGGLATVAAGLIAKAFGPIFGGFFLAFPAIFPAGATLIAKRERQKKAKKGLRGDRRGREAAALDASGAVLGAIALMGFAALIWRAIPVHAPAFVLILSAVLWLAVSIGLWWLSEQDSRVRRLCRRQG